MSNLEKEHVASNGIQDLLFYQCLPFLLLLIHWLCLILCGSETLDGLSVISRLEDGKKSFPSFYRGFPPLISINLMILKFSHVFLYISTKIANSVYGHYIFVK